MLVVCRPSPPRSTRVTVSRPRISHPRRAADAHYKAELIAKHVARGLKPSPAWEEG